MPSTANRSRPRGNQNRFAATLNNSEAGPAVPAQVDALAFAAREADARQRGRAAVERLRTHVPRQLFEVVIQARVRGGSIARARVAPLRKDVLTTGGSKSVGGGDRTRKMKLLEKQKRGKARQKTIGRVALGQDALWAVVGGGG